MSIMLLEENKELVRRFYEEVVGGGNLDLIETMVAEDIYDYHAAPAGWLPGRAGFKQHCANIHEALANVSVTVNDLIAEGDRVVSFWTGQGLHRGPFMGFAPSNQVITWTSVSVLRMRNGQITEYRARPDKFTVMEKFRLVPA